MNISILSALKEIPLFRRMPARELREIAVLFRKKSCRLTQKSIIDVSKEILLYERVCKNDEVYFILRGSVKVVKLRDSARQEIMYFLRRGDFFGENDNEKVIAIARENMDYLVMPRADFNRMLLKLPIFKKKIDLALARKRTEEEIKSIFFAKKSILAKTRIKMFLRFIKIKFGNEMKVTNKEIAQYIGCSENKIAKYK